MTWLIPPAIAVIVILVLIVIRLGQRQRTTPTQATPTAGTATTATPVYATSSNWGWLWTIVIVAALSGVGFFAFKNTFNGSLGGWKTSQAEVFSRTFTRSNPNAENTDRLKPGKYRVIVEPAGARFKIAFNVNEKFDWNYKERPSEFVLAREQSVKVWADWNATPSGKTTVRIIPNS